MVIWEGGIRKTNCKNLKLPVWFLLKMTWKVYLGPPVVMHLTVSRVQQKSLEGGRIFAAKKPFFSFSFFLLFVFKWDVAEVEAPEEAT